MAVIILKPDPKDKKHKKDYIDLSVAYRKYKKMHKSYKTAFLLSFFVNIITISYITLFK